MVQIVDFFTYPHREKSGQEPSLDPFLKNTKSQSITRLRPLDLIISQGPASKYHYIGIRILTMSIRRKQTFSALHLHPQNITEALCWPSFMLHTLSPHHRDTFTLAEAANTCKLPEVQLLQHCLSALNAQEDQLVSWKTPGSHP